MQKLDKVKGNRHSYIDKLLQIGRRNANEPVVPFTNENAGIKVVENNRSYFEPGPGQLLAMSFPLECVKYNCLREQSFLILGTGAEDFWQGYETFSNILWGYKNIKSNIYGYITI